MKQKIISVILVGTLTFSMLAGCGGAKTENVANDSQTETGATNKTAEDKEEKVSDNTDKKPPCPYRRHNI